MGIRLLSRRPPLVMLGILIVCLTAAGAVAAPKDRKAPSTPKNVRVTAATQAAISLAWDASSDNVGVAGYGLYRDGSLVATTTALSTEFADLVCGTAYRLAFDAFDAAGNRSARAELSTPTGACPEGPPDNTTPPAVHGTAQIGENLVADKGSWTNGPTSYQYQWQRCGAVGCSDISDAREESYAVGDADLNARLRVLVTAANTVGSATANSDETPPVLDPPPVNTTAPTVDGRMHVGQTVSASPGLWVGADPITFTYQWLRCGASGADCLAIVGATGTSYRVASLDAGGVVAVVIKATDVNGSTSIQSPAVPVTADSSALSVAQEAYSGGSTNGTGPCFGVDWGVSYELTGSLAPGESYTFYPQKPLCHGAEEPLIVATVAWDAGGSPVRLSAEQPAPIPFRMTTTDLAMRDVGLPIVGTRLASGTEERLCIFTSPWLASDTSDRPWSLTVTNAGSTRATNVRLHGFARNGWPYYYGRPCSLADGDADGWNDSLESGMRDLGSTAYDGEPASLELDRALWGASHLRATGTPTPDDEHDFYPADLDDDGQVTDEDVRRVERFLGQGTGYSVLEVHPNRSSGAAWYYANQGAWRRADLDGNGAVDARDVSVVNRLLGTPVPYDKDVVPPAADVRAPAEGEEVAAGGSYNVQLFGLDNRQLRRLELFVNGKLACTTNVPATNCGWNVPRGAGGTYKLVARATDAAGLVADSPAVTVTSR